MKAASHETLTRAVETLEASLPRIAVEPDSPNDRLLQIDSEERVAELVPLDLAMLIGDARDAVAKLRELVENDPPRGERAE